jgi:hypothetical protein
MKKEKPLKSGTKDPDKKALHLKPAAGKKSAGAVKKTTSEPPIDELEDGSPSPLSSARIKDLFPTAVFAPENAFNESGGNEPLMNLEPKKRKSAKAISKDSNTAQKKKPTAGKGKIVKFSRRELEDGSPSPMDANIFRDLFPTAISFPDEPSSGFTEVVYFDVPGLADENPAETVSKPTKKSVVKKKTPKTGKAITFKKEDIEDGSPSPISSKRVRDLFRSTDSSPKNVKENPD